MAMGRFIVSPIVMVSWVWNLPNVHFKYWLQLTFNLNLSKAVFRQKGLTVGGREGQVCEAHTVSILICHWKRRPPCGQCSSRPSPQLRLWLPGSLTLLLPRCSWSLVNIELHLIFTKSFEFPELLVCVFIYVLALPEVPCTYLLIN